MTSSSRDPSAEPGGERRSLRIPISIAGGIVLTIGIWWASTPHGPLPPLLVFENPRLGCRFEYPSELTAGPNFVRTISGSLLTIERHSLAMAKKDWVAGLPEVLFPQVLIQLQENYADLEETARTHPAVGGRSGVEIVLRGSLKKSSPMMITILIFANDDWVYVVRSYSPERLDAIERPLFRKVRETWSFIPEAGEQKPS